MSSEERQEEVEQHVDELLQQPGEEGQPEEYPPAGSAPEEEGSAHLDEGEEEAAAPTHAVAPPAADEGEIYDPADVSDKRVYISEVRRIDASTMTLARGLTAMCSQDDEEVRANIIDIFNDLQAEEANLFSPMPDYVARILGAEAQRRANRNKAVQPHPEIARGERTAMTGSYGEEHRAFVDPGVPLSLPYNLQREAAQNPQRNNAAGTYHDLFYGDGSQCVFEPPADNKRQQLAEERRAHPRMESRPPVSYEPPARPVMKVAKDFVPSCADLTSKSPRDASHSAVKRSSGTTPKKSARPQWRR